MANGDNEKLATLGERLKNLREERGISQREMTIRSGVAQKTISRIENGIDSPRLGTFLKLLEVLEVEVELVEREGTVPQDPQVEIG